MQVSFRGQCLAQREKVGQYKGYSLQFMEMQSDGNNRQFSVDSDVAVDKNFDERSIP